jgi:predicted nucleic acid-binding protein
MSIGIVDTTVIVHYFRNYVKAREWVDTQAEQLSLVAITWMEVMEGASNKANQKESRRILDKFELLYLTNADQHWAMQQLERYQFSHHIGKEDCLIASVAYRLQVPLYTHNNKDMNRLIGDLAVKPYD